MEHNNMTQEYPSGGFESNSDLRGPSPHDTRRGSFANSMARKVLGKFRSRVVDQAHSPEVSTHKPKSTAWKIKVGIILSLLAVWIILTVWFYTRPEDYNISFPDKNPIVDSSYYFTTLTSTVGFGDIYPKTVGAKVFTGAYQLFLTAISFGAIYALTGTSLKKLKATIGEMKAQVQEVAFTSTGNNSSKLHNRFVSTRSS